MCVYLPLLFLVCAVIGQCIHSSEGLVVFPLIIEWEDSTVVGILRRSPASGERVSECVQSGSVSEGQGTSYSISCTCHNTHILKHDMNAQYAVIHVAVEVRKQTLYRQLILRKWCLKFSNYFDVIIDVVLDCLLYTCNIPYSTQTSPVAATFYIYVCWMLNSSQSTPDTQSIMPEHHLRISTIKRTSNAHMHMQLSNVHTCNCSGLFTSFIHLTIVKWHMYM